MLAPLGLRLGSGWEWATRRFHGRRDDRDSNFRTANAGSTLLACLLELLAYFRPDPLLLRTPGQGCQPSGDARGQ